MPRPRRRYPFDSKYDFSYRPETYWPETPTEETTLAKVKGTARRDLARRALEEGKDTPLGEIDVEFAFAESLDEDDLRERGGIHPALMGGEYLPDPAEGEVEIARVELRSTTGDVIQILARRNGPNAKQRRIRYRVVDEYMDDGHAYLTVPVSSAPPLSFGQLVDLIDLTRSVGTNTYKDDKYNVGLVDSTRDYNYAESGWEEDSLRYFFRVSSAFYPQLERYFDERMEHWYRSVMLPLIDENLPLAAFGPREPTRPVAPDSYPPDTLLAVPNRSSEEDRRVGTVDRAAVELWFRYVAGLDLFEIRVERHRRGPYHYPGSLERIEARWLVEGQQRTVELENSVASLLPYAEPSSAGAENLARDLRDPEIPLQRRVALAFSMDNTGAASDLTHELAAEAPFEAADYLELLGRVDEVASMYRIATDRSLEAVWALLRLGHTDEAELLFRASSDHDAILGLAAIARVRGDEETALELYERWRRQAR